MRIGRDVLLHASVCELHVHGCGMQIAHG
jgi:hypothetical protein